MLSLPGLHGDQTHLAQCHSTPNPPESVQDQPRGRQSRHVCPRMNKHPSSNRSLFVLSDFLALSSPMCHQKMVYEFFQVLELLFFFRIFYNIKSVAENGNQGPFEVRIVLREVLLKRGHLKNSAGPQRMFI